MGKNLPSAEQSGSRRARDQEASRVADAWRVSVRLHTYTRDSAKHHRRIGRPRTGAQATRYNNQPVRDLMPSVTQPGQTQIPGKVAALLTNAKETHTKKKRSVGGGGKTPKISQGDRAEMCSRQPFLTLLIAD